MHFLKMYLTLQTCLKNFCFIQMKTLSTKKTTARKQVTTGRAIRQN
jgi:hypothetical protein